MGPDLMLLADIAIGAGGMAIVIAAVWRLF
jgi:hypothetical protein